MLFRSSWVSQSRYFPCTPISPLAMSRLTKTSNPSDLKPKVAATKPMTAQDLYRVLNRISEKKYKDVLQSYTVIDNVGSIWDLTDVVQGTSDTQRIGDSFLPTDIEIRGQVHGADATNCMRIILFRWNQDSNATTDPQPSNILQSTFTSTDMAPYAPYYHDKTPNFWIIHDERIALTGSTDSSSYVSNFEIKRHLQTKPVSCTNGAASSAGTYKLYLLVISDSGAVNHPAVTFGSRMFFRDH